MVKAVKALQLLYPKMIYVTCFTHALHRVAEEVCGSYPEVDQLIATGKKIFIKSPLRVQKVKKEDPTLPLSPQPIVTHWGTWLDAANYCCTNYSEIERRSSISLTQKIHLQSNLYRSCFQLQCQET
jgi:hypothetical protein